MIPPAAACLAAAVVSALGMRYRWLTRAGAIAATGVGTAVLSGAGWGGGAMLGTFFVSGSLLSRWGERRVAAPARDGKSGPRDALQVLANGLPAAVGALAAPPGISSLAIVGGALAAAAADTWGTELGTALGGKPVLITTLRPVATGTSGAVTWVGLAGSICGACAVAVAGRLFGLPRGIVPLVAAAGLTGALLDSLGGAILQGRFRCEPCEVDTERRVHRCGRQTVTVGGLTWLTNDGVNLLATTWGGGVVLLWLSLSSP